MKTLSREASKVMIKEAVTEWISFLAEGNYQAAVEMLATKETEGIFISEDPYQDESPRTWDMKSLKTELTGLDGNIYKIAPVTDELKDKFEQYLKVAFYFDEEDEFNDPDDEEMSPTIGDIHVALPLINDDGPYLSDLTARLDLFKYLEDKLALSLRDIHVM